MKQILYTITTLFMMSATGVQAQVTIGELKDPESFSILELVSTGKGLRLPQMTTEQRETMQATPEFTAKATAEAMGLQIFNIDTKCIETWNGTEWIMQCDCGDQPCPEQPLSAVSCGIIASNSDKTFTAIADPAAVKYEFFDGTSSQGKQTSNVIDFKSARTPSNITVRYYYPLSFLKPKMLPVEGGSYTIGAAVLAATTGSSTSGTNGAVYNNHSVTISDFTMSETPVTQAQYESVMGGNPSYFQCSNSSYKQYVECRPTSALPVDYVNFYNAIIYCNRLSKIEQKTPCYSVSGGTYTYTADELAEFAYNDIRIPTSSVGNVNTAWNTNVKCDFTADGYRLPTEAEWEYAARGGQLSQTNANSSTDYYYSGSNSFDDFAWCSDNSGSSSSGCSVNEENSYFGTKPVKTKSPNELGLYDMSGNVYEWCWDRYVGYSTTSDTNNPTGAATGSRRVLRGGSWGDVANLCRVSDRNYNDPYERYFHYGFRVVCR